MTRIAMASCPIAMNRDVDGYIAMILGPTYTDVLVVFVTGAYDNLQWNQMSNIQRQI